MFTKMHFPLALWQQNLVACSTRGSCAGRREDADTRAALLLLSKQSKRPSEAPWCLSRILTKRRCSSDTTCGLCAGWWQPVASAPQTGHPTLLRFSRWVVLSASPSNTYRIIFWLFLCREEDVGLIWAVLLEKSLQHLDISFLWWRKTNLDSIRLPGPPHTASF